jgi:hypothetical protein
MTAIPWQDPATFQEACFFLATMDRARPRAFARVRETAAQIAGLMTQLDPEMAAMCRVTCPDCRDNCCARATIWYDFKDLLFLYFNALPLPDRQIRKQVRGGSPTCIHLTETGCDLQRLRRPFVCTWYLCERQKNMAGTHGIQAGILKSQVLRREMEDIFCRN